MNRSGQPSPLTFHLASAAMASQQALLMAGAGVAGLPWHDSLREQAALLEQPDQRALAAESLRRLRAMLDGIEAWQKHPWRRSVSDPEAVWSQGSSRLLDYGTAPEASDPGGAPVLVVPSLINRAYILDLAQDHSFLRALARRGLRPFLLDWGPPGFEERNFSFSDYVQDRLLPALAVARALSRQDCALVGYCMGGTLAAGLAANRPQGVSALVTLGAPWSFAGNTGVAGAIRGFARSDPARRLEGALDALGQAFGLVPIDLFQLLFALLNPIQAAVKFRRFAGLDPDSAEARHFVALEDWLADGVPMAVPAAKDLLIGWQVDNAPGSGRWSFLGRRVDPGSIRLPALIVSGSRDHIAPPDSAQPLATAIPGAHSLTVAAGHVGMLAGSQARQAVWTPVADFLLQNRG